MKEKPEAVKKRSFVSKSGLSIDCMNVKVRTERLVLSPISYDYAEEIFQNFTSEVTRYMAPHPPSKIDGIYDFINGSLKNMEQGEEIIFAVLNSKTSEFLGCCGLHGRGTPHTPEVGIWIKMAAHGNGFGKEAIFGLKKWADENLKLEYLTYPVDRSNYPSRKIPEALGGEISEEVVKTTDDGRKLDEVVYWIYPKK